MKTKLTDDGVLSQAVGVMKEACQPTRAGLMADPGVSFWLKGALEKASQRDSLDALRDAEMLARVLRAEYGQEGGL